MIFQVFDKAMCCSTGICGPQVDDTLVRFAADLDWLNRHGVPVERYSLSQQPQQFATQEDVRAILQDKGTGALPIIRVDGHIVSQGIYPARDSLAAWAHVNPAAAELLPIVENCSPNSGCCQ